MKMQDDRTPEQKRTHTWLIVGTDRFSSNWPHAKNGKSYAAWACKSEHRHKVREWVESRSDMMRVRETTENEYVGKYRPSGHGHCHIYVVEEGHPALV
jgi:hypothetical protein